ncbi:MAG: hypothetical protein L7F78_23305 [Syntrophales bacterium LBB04]|nr:hypothetical protein [Syntrophales bacterium LBB04]
MTVPPRMPRQDTLAYQNKSVETEKVIRMQWVEALIPAHYLLTHHDRNVLPSQLNLVDGSEVWKKQGAAL